MTAKKILLYQGGRYFGIEKNHKNFQGILEGYVVDNYETVDIFSNKDFFEYSALIFFSQEGEFTQEQEANVLDFVHEGKGFVGLHGASASFKSHPKYFEMLGGKFIAHKEPMKFDINFLDNSHPITKGLSDFEFKDEPYRHDLSMGEDLHLLAEAHYHDKEDPEPEPMMWVKKYGKGKVFYCSLGHRNLSLKEEIYQVLIKRAVKWVLNFEKGDV
ncbi:MAG: ThuA domain-containing protein [Promethearchaeota archaeon]|nr:MAG: ThuA domain-containing protein [Candidatus Lokiarchaeota archaeon]